MSKSLKALEKLTKGNASNSDVTLIKRELKEKALLEKIVKNQIKVIGYYENLALKDKLESDKRLEAIKIIKSLAYFDIIEVQGQWYLIQGILFEQSLKMPITKKQAILLKEVLL